MRIPRPFPDSNAGRFPRSAAFLSALAACSVLAVGCSGGEELSDVSVQLSTSSVDATPFPSDRFTVSDCCRLPESVQIWRRYLVA